MNTYLRRGVFPVGVLAVLASVFCCAPLRAEPPQAITPSFNCSQNWQEAGTLAAKDAGERARLAAGAAPSGVATSWSEAWTRAWGAAWRMAPSLIAQSRDCCDPRWFEQAAQAGKNAWQQAWQAAATLSGADQAWADRYAATYADEWAKEWFVHYPWLCARARAKAYADAYADAGVDVDVSAQAWAHAAASVKVLADARAAVWTEVWTEAGASAWAAAGATAMASAFAAAESSALAAVSGNCAYARAQACAAAAAAAFAEAWAESGASAFANAYAAAWAEASARALASAWARAIARATAYAWAEAWSEAYAEACARAFAAVWRQTLANQGQLSAIVNWWRTPGAPRPALDTIRKVLAAAYERAFDSWWDWAWDQAWDRRKDFQQAFANARREAIAQVRSWSRSWVSAWSEAWASSWIAAWARAYAMLCSRAAAAVCVECRCTTTTGTIGRPRGFTWTLTGLGVSAGTIFQIAVQNQTSDPLVVQVPAGTVFKPSNPEYQRTITAGDQNIEVPPNQTTKAPVEGYCLDYGLKPPPASAARAAGAKGSVLLASTDPLVVGALLAVQAGQPASVHYALDDNPVAYAAFRQIIQAGNRLAAEGKLHTDLPAAQHKLAVIQRAIWTHATRGSSQPHTKDTLLADIRKQVREAGGTQTEQQIQELVNHLWEDVEAVLRAAGLR